MLAVGLKRILELFIGSMGIKSAHLGTKTIYEKDRADFCTLNSQAKKGDKSRWQVFSI